MRRAALLGAVLLALTAPPVVALDGASPPPRTLNTLLDVRKALRQCWQWPPLNKSRPGMELTIRLSFRRNGEIFGARITYHTREVTDEERAAYYEAMAAALARCSPLPFSDSLGGAIAGHPLVLHIHDSRQERKA